MRLNSIFLLCWMPCACIAVSADASSEQAGVHAFHADTSDLRTLEAIAADASMVLPGDFSEQTTLSDLQARFGAVNVQVTETTADDGVVSRSAVLFPEDPTRRAYVRFYSSTWSHGLAEVAVRDAGSRWRGKHGARIGMSLAELRAINGKPFYLEGFDDQNRGWARDQWSPSLDDTDSVPGKLDVEAGDHLYFGVDFGLRGSVGAPTAGAFPRDASFSSDDARYPGLGELFEVIAISAYSSLDDEW